MNRWLTIAMILMLAAGCNSTRREDPEEKRAQDRMAMQLADAERDRDQLKGEVARLRADAEQAAKAQTDAQTQLSQLRQQIATLQSNQASADSLTSQLRTAETQLKTAQAQLADSQNRVRELQVQIDALKTQLAAPTTAPMREMNK